MLDLLLDVRGWMDENLGEVRAEQQRKIQVYFFPKRAVSQTTLVFPILLR